MQTAAQLTSSAMMKMTPAGTTTTNNDRRPGTGNTFADLPGDEQTVVINHIFKILRREFSGQFLKYEKEVKDWLLYQRKRLVSDESFRKLTKDQIRAGIDKACKGKFLPSMGELVSLCKPSASDYGLPSAIAAWTEACNHSHEVCSHQWSHNAVHLSGQKTGWHSIRTASGEREVAKLQKAFFEHYQAIAEEIEKKGGLQGDAVAALTDQSKDSEAEKAERYGKFLADKAVTEMGLPTRMTGSDALARLRQCL